MLEDENCLGPSDETCWARAGRSVGESCEWHLRREKSNNMYLLPLFPLEKGMGGLTELGEGEERNQCLVERHQRCV